MTNQELAMQLAKEAYEAYANHTAWRSLATGQPLPQWESLSAEIQKAWAVSAAWVAGKVAGNHDWQIPIKDRAFADRIKEETMHGDNETGHMTADDLLCELLVSIGCTESVAAFQAVGKWYA
jgi:hypothetical protein